MKTGIQKLQGRCEVLEAIINDVANIYSTGDKDVQSFLLVSLGASLFYLPHSENLCYSGKMSKRAYEKLLSGEVLYFTKEHQHPRKLSAKELVEKAQNGLPLNLLEDYLGKYSVFNYVLPQENKKLIPYQKEGVFTSPEEAYRLCGIELVDVSLTEIKRLRKLNKTKVN